jgi:hypothetical protein
MNWATAWKAAAKQHRRQEEWWKKQAISELTKRASLETSKGIQEAKDVIMLRRALDGLLRCSAYREYGQCGQCEQRAVIALRKTAPSDNEDCEVVRCPG